MTKVVQLLVELTYSDEVTESAALVMAARAFEHTRANGMLSNPDDEVSCDYVTVSLHTSEDECDPEKAVLALVHSYLEKRNQITDLQARIDQLESKGM